MGLLKITHPSIRATEYKQWYEDGRLIQVYKWGGGENFAYRLLVSEKGCAFNETEVRAVTKSYYENLPVKAIKIR